MKNAIGARIAHQRVLQNLSQQALADKAGIPYPTLQNYETGRREPKAQQLQKIAEALDVSILILLTEYLDDETVVGKGIALYEKDKTREHTREEIAEMKFTRPSDESNMTRQKKTALNNVLVEKLKYTIRALPVSEHSRLENVFELYCKLNEEGRERMMETLEDIYARPKYQKRRASKGRRKEDGEA
jgi:transcriptional regulator with XRE-family HTH domain